MYLEHFGLKEEPFNITPDPKFLFPTTQHQAALAGISRGVSTRKGIIALIGEAGTGKSTLIRTLLKGLNGNTVSAWVFNTTLQQEELISYICKDFGLNIKSGDQSGRLMELHRFLMSNYENGKNAILVVDEAQNVAPELLEQIRQLTNLETLTQKLLQVILSGQPQLEKKLSKPELRQLDQRIGVRAKLSRLSRDETEQYIRHRINIAGGKSEEMFTDEAMNMIYDVAKGIPRLVNVVCDNVMVRAKKEGIKRIEVRIITDLLDEGLITTAQGQRITSVEKPKKSLLSTRLPRKIIKYHIDGSNGNGKKPRIFEPEDKYAGLDLGMLAIA